MPGRSGDVKRGAVKTARFCVLSLLLTTVASGVSAAPGASGQPLSATPASPSSAAIPPLLDIPAGGTVPDAPTGSPRNPNSMPMPAPAPTDHYADSAGYSSRPVFLP
jgi:hypothetical protein